MLVFTTLLMLLANAASTPQTQQSTLHLDQSRQLEVVPHKGGFITYVVGDVVFSTETGKIYCDSAVLLKGEYVRLNGSVWFDDAEYSLRADSVYHDLVAGTSDARGERVELWSFADSVYAVGPHAFYDKENEFFYMNGRPLLYLNYPDSASMVEVLADSIEYRADSSQAYAEGEVLISSEEFSSRSGIAVMNGGRNLLELLDNPSARRENSDIFGDTIRVAYANELISRIDVIDSARADFSQPTDSTESDFDRSKLAGDRIIFNFDEGRLAEILCHGQAYSWYYPSARGGTEFHENSVSGDSIRLVIDKKSLQMIDVLGGAVGTYVSGQQAPGDTAKMVLSADTVDYRGQFIRYSLADSMITLEREADVTSDDVSLIAYRVNFDTRENLIKAYSGTFAADSLPDPYSFTVEAQPNPVPVRLEDGADEVLGDYLEYSTDTEKGRIVRSKTEYDPGFYYGQKLFREQENIFYIQQGRFTTCDAQEPHFHFRSTNLKLIEGDKLIARPVVFYIGRLPIMMIPYYVFPLKRGRHSGFLPFTFGNFGRGERYVRDVGYYWAASEYWDWQGSFDYYDNANTYTLNSRVNFAKRYVIERTYLQGSYTTENDYNTSQGVEGGTTSWTVKGAYNHNISPSLKLAAYGEYQSSETYYKDYSPNLDERLNREIKSKATITKAFGSKTKLTSTFSHTVNLDYESRTDYMPTASLSLPVMYPFGNGRTNEEGKLEQSWYNKIKFTYSPSLTNYSARTTDEEYFDDTSFVDSIFDDETGTWIPGIDTVITEDTLSYRTRKEYAKIQHSPKVTLPTVTLAKYFNFIPSFGYSETWFKIFETDQSLEADVEADIYRTYSWNASISANTNLYGTISPNIGGLLGLRHVVSPRVTYTYKPDIDRHPGVRSYAGGGAGSTKSQAAAFSVTQDFQAKVRSGETEKTLNLLTLTSGFSYDFEKDEHPYSDLITGYRSDAVPLVHISGSMTHSLYKPDTDELDFWSPYLKKFSFNASLDLKGAFPFFDEPGSVGIDDGADSASQVDSGGSWSCNLDYEYSESGRGASWSKTDYFFLMLSVNFDLTPNTSVSYSQRYDFMENKTIHNSVSIKRKLHCWSGSLYWVPVGSNRGFGFKLYVTDLPEIKLDNGHDDFLTGIQGLQ